MPVQNPPIDDPTGLQTLEIISRARSFNRWMYETIRPFLGGQILEIGSGIGNISEFIIASGEQIMLSDYNPAYCLALQQHYGGAPNVNGILCLDLQAPDFTELHTGLRGQFNTIFLLNVIEHLEDDAKAVRYCASLLKPGGRLLLLAPAYQSLYARLDKELGHFRRYRKEDFRRLLNGEGFRVAHLQYFNFLGLVGWFVFGRIGGDKQLTAGKFDLFNRLVPVARLLDRLLFNSTGVSVIAVGEKR